MDYETLKEDQLLFDYVRSTVSHREELSEEILVDVLRILTV
jgi:hypothetical protein